MCITMHGAENVKKKYIRQQWHIAGMFRLRSVPVLSGVAVIFAVALFVGAGGGGQWKGRQNKQKNLIFEIKNHFTCPRNFQLFSQMKEFFINVVFLVQICNFFWRWPLSLFGPGAKNLATPLGLHTEVLTRNLLSTKQIAATRPGPVV